MPSSLRPDSHRDSASLPSAASAVSTSRDDGNRFVTRRFNPILMASVPALLLGLGVAFQYSIRGATDENRARSSYFSPNDLARNVVLNESQTFVVEPKTNAISASSVIWHARLLSGKGVTGTAPIDGQITRVWVKEGQSVQVGDRVLRIAASSAALPEAPALPSIASRRAENAQVEASQAQNRLQSKMMRAQQDLVAAQQRVARAKTRIAQTTEIVRQLRAGAASDEIAPDDASVSNIANAPIEFSNSENSAEKSRDNVAQKAAIQAHAANVRETQIASRKAESAESAASDAERDATKAEVSARALTQKARQLHEQHDREVAQRDAAQNANAAQNDADEPLARTSNAAETNASATPKATPRPLKKITVSASTVAAAEAQAKSATDSANAAREKARNLKNVAASARSEAQKSSEKATRALKQLQIFGDDNASETRVNAPSRSVSQTRRATAKTVRKLPTIREAALMVQAATEESASAQRDATRLKMTVDEYSKQAQSAQQNFDSSSDALESAQQTAQQSSLDRTLTANLSVMRAPSTGVVLWVAPVTQTVNSGDAIIRMSGQGALKARFVDYSGRWRTLKPATILPASLAPQNDASANLSPKNTAKNAISSTRNAIAQSGKADKSNANSATSPISANAPTTSPAVLARVESVTPPVRAGAPAIVQMAVFAAPDSARRASNGSYLAPETLASRAPRLRAGMKIFCAVGKAGAAESSTLQVPNSAFLLADETFLSAAIKANKTAITSDENSSQDAANPIEKLSENSATSATSAASETRNSAPASASPSDENIAVIAVLKPLDDDSQLNRVEWRRVQMSETENGMRHVISGLQPGERVALQPSILRTFVQNNGYDMMVRLRDNA